MTVATFIGFRDLIYEKSGIYFPDNKKYVLDSRLASRLAEHNCTTFEEYLALLRTDTWRNKELPALFNAITTNETFFFRDLPQLQAFSDLIVPAMIKTNQATKSLKIWSAACSTGDEAFTLAILLLERHREGARLGAPGVDGWNVEGARPSGKEPVLAGSGLAGAMAPGVGGWNVEGARPSGKEPVEMPVAPQMQWVNGSGIGGKKGVSAALGREGAMAGAMADAEKTIPAALNNHQAFGSRKLGLAGGWNGDLRGWNVEVAASDISEAALGSARRGTYGSYAIRHVSPLLLSRYFTLEAGLHCVKPELKRLVRFAHINLFETARVKLMKGMDIIFCRNCLIYFDDKAKKRVVDSFYDCLNPGGYLVIGFSESLHNLTRAFHPISSHKTVIYQKV